MKNKAGSATIIQRFRLHQWGIAILAIVLFTACSRKREFSYQVSDRKLLMFEEIKKDTNFSILTAALEKTNLAGVLSSYGPYTLFAPDNNAFRKYFKLKGKTGLSDFPDSVLSNVMKYHIVPTRLKAPDFIQGPQTTPSSSGDNINIDISKGFKNTAIANASSLIYETDIEYYNGYVHKMDGVLDPPTLTIGEFLLANQNVYSIITSGLKAAGLMDTLSRLTNNFGVRIRLTLFAETDEALKAAGVTNYNGYSQDSLVKYMRNHLITGVGTRASYTHQTVAIPQIKQVARWDSTITTLDGQDWLYFDLAADHILDGTTDFLASDLSMRNGLVHNINKPLAFPANKKRTQIFHRFWAATNYCYGIPGFRDGIDPPVANSSAGFWRYYFDGNGGNGYQVTNLTFCQPDGPGDSMVTVIRGIRRGRYLMEASGKNGARTTCQINYQSDSISTYDFSFPGLPQYRQNANVGTYNFRTSGDKRLNFIFKNWGGGIGINIECLMLTPVN